MADAAPIKQRDSNAHQELEVDRTWQDTGADHSLLIGLACACAILQLSLMEQRGAITVPSWLVFIGGASYALYLVHNVTISIVARLVPQTVPAILAAGIAASIVAGIAYYIFLERPLLWSARRWPKQIRAA